MECNKQIIGKNHLIKTNLNKDLSLLIMYKYT